jgi:hypothetical protein
MTIERRVIGGIEDIKAISFECKKCKRRLTSGPEFVSLLSIPLGCPCGHPWRPALQGNPVDMNEDAFIKLVAGVQRIRALEKEGSLGVRVLFEFDEPIFTPPSVG